VYLDLDVLAAAHNVARVDATGRDDVAELGRLLVLDQRDPRGPVGVVLEALDDARGLARSLKVDEAVPLLVAAALGEHANTAVVVAAALPALARGQRLDGLSLTENRKRVG